MRLGVRMWIEDAAVAKRWRRSVLRGVGGVAGVGRKGRGRERVRVEWWGEGRRMVGWGVGGRGILVGRETEGVVVALWRLSSLAGRGEDEGSRAGSFPPSQKHFQNSSRLPTTGPSRLIQHSNHVSQLTLQLGMHALARSTTTNFGCITLNGRKNKLFTSRSRPRNSSGDGSPSFLSHSSGL